MFGVWRSTTQKGADVQIGCLTTRWRIQLMSNDKTRPLSGSRHKNQRSPFGLL